MSSMAVLCPSSRFQGMGAVVQVEAVGIRAVFLGRIRGDAVREILAVPWPRRRLF